MKRKYLIHGWIFTVIGACCTDAQAQTPMTDLPAGRRIAGWAVERIPAAPRSLDAMADAMGQNVESFSGDFKLLQGSKAPGATDIIAGRAFFVVQSQGRYMLSAQFTGLRSHDNCGIRLSIGGMPVINENFMLPANNFRGIQTVNGTVVLNPGYYPIKFSVQCWGVGTWNRQSAILAIRVRSEYEASLHAFRSDELLHIRAN